MLDKKTFLAVIPARGGSKRLPRKNMLLLHGKPLIAWTIEAAQKSKYIDQIALTSDDKDILDIAGKYGVKAIKRPPELSTDHSPTFDAIEHAVKSIKKRYDYIVLLQPTSPLRDNRHIDEAIELLVAKNADSIISVCETEHSPLWCNTLSSDQSMTNFLKDEVKNSRSQDLPLYYRLNGAIYIIKTDKLLSEKSAFLKKGSFAYIMDREASIDIDTKSDFLFADFLLQKDGY